jgi:hypothetical protein
VEKYEPRKFSYIECECSLAEHILRISVDDMFDYEAPLIVEMRLSHFMPWYRRIVLAFKYIFKMDTKLCQYEETIIPQSSFPKLRDIIDEAESIGQKKLDELAK